MDITNTKTVASLSTKSNKAIGIFKQTVQTLNNINADINKQTQERQKKVELLNSEIQQYETIKSQNEKWANKINEFLGE